MKNLFNKYCDFIGVENEGYRRLILVSIILLGITNPLFFNLDLDEYIPTLFFLHRDGWVVTLQVYFFILFPSIIFGIIIKVINWVKHGFNN